MNIVKFINTVNDLYGTETTPKRFDTTQWLRPGFRGAGLVDHGPEGVRQGYADKDLPMNIFKTSPNQLTVQIKRGIEGKKTISKSFTFGSGKSQWEKNYKNEEAALKAAKDFLKKNKQRPDFGIEPGARGAPLKMEEVKKAIKGYNYKKSDGTFKDWKDLTQNEARIIRANLNNHDGKFVKPFSKPFRGAKPIPDKLKKALKANFPEVEFKFDKPYKYGFNVQNDPDLWSKVRFFTDDYERGHFRLGDTPEQNLWHSLYRSSQKEGSRWQLHSRKPKNWSTNANWKKAVFEDTKTGELIKFNDIIENPNAKSLKDYLGSKTYNKALLPFKNKKEVLNQTIKYKGKDVKVSKFLKDQFIERKTIEKYGVNYKPADKTKMFKKWQIWSPLNVNHPYGVKDNWWTGEVTTRTANIRLQDLTKTLNATTNEVARKELITRINKLDAQYFEQGLELGKEPKLTRVVKEAFKEQGAGRTLAANKDFVKWIKKFPCMKADGGAIDIDCHIKGMRHEKNLLVEGKGSRAIADKFLDGTKLARKGGTLKAILGLGGLLGDLVFEGGYAAVNYYGGKDEADIWKHSWYSFMDPTLWKDGKYVGWTSDAEKQKQYEIRDEDGNVTGIRKNVKRYYDNVDKIEKQSNLYDNLWSAKNRLYEKGQIKPEKEAVEAINKARTELSNFNTRINLEGGMDKIYKDLKYDQPYVDTRQETVVAQEAGLGRERLLKDFEKIKSWGGFSKDMEYEDKFDKPYWYKRRYGDLLEYKGAEKPSYYFPGTKTKDPRFEKPWATRGGLETDAFKFTKSEYDQVVADAVRQEGVDRYSKRPYQPYEEVDPWYEWKMEQKRWGLDPSSYEDQLGKRQYIRAMGGLDLMDKIGLAGGVSKMAGGGLANLTRTVAPDSGPMSQGLRSLYIDDMD